MKFADGVDSLTMTKGNNAIQGVKDHRRVNHLVVVELSEILDFGNSLLVKLEVVLLQTQRDLLEDVVHNANDKVLVIPVKGTDEDREKVDVAIFNLYRLAEDAFQNIDHLSRS